MLFIRNFTSTTKTNTRNEIRLVQELAKIPHVEVRSIETLWSKVTRNGSTFKELTITFNWHGFEIRMENTPQYTTEVFMENVYVGEIWWDAYTGYHRNKYASESSQIQKNICDILEKVLFNISEQKNVVLRMRDILTINDCKVMAKKAEIRYTYPDGRKGMLLAKDQFGRLTDNVEAATFDIMRFIKKNYVVID